MEDNLTLDDKLEEVQELARRRKKIKIIIDSSIDNFSGTLALWLAGDYIEINMEREDKGLKEYIDDYFKKELEKVDEKLNEILK